MTIYAAITSIKIQFFKSPNRSSTFADFFLTLKVFNNVNNDIKIDFEIQSQGSQLSSTKIKKIHQ